MSNVSTDRGFAALVHDFASPAGHFDELIDERRALRPVWADFAAHAGEITPAQLTRAQMRVDRQIHENGVTYNVYAGSDGLSRPWTLDVLPFVMPAAEWDGLSFGLRQRARVLNAVAADLYGSRRLLHEGLLPPSLLYAHPGFLRPCHGASPTDGVFLHLVAFDLSREPDGRWLVLETRAQAPSGIGYALENRVTIARLFPQAFRALHVQPLQAFIHALRQSIVERAPVAAGETPHVALLTPGPYNETYFEHAFLAKQLGFPLVEGGDLTVRHDRVFLKTVSGLRPVHALLRRLDDDYCDPLELRTDSTLGVPGLVQAWRAGHVLVANAFGTGVLESRALAERLPAVCDRLLGETLATTSPAAGDRLALSHVPVWAGGSLVSRAMMLRVFLAADGRGDYHLMPGALARIAGDDRDRVSAQRGGGSKDTWVLSSVPGDAIGLPEPRGRHERVYADEAALVSSRAAEHLFWLGRYAERSENAARLLRAVLERLTDADALPARMGPLVLEACRAHGLLASDEGAASGRVRSTTLERALIDGMLDLRRHQSLGFNVAQTVRVADATRDRLSSDNWRLLNRLHQQVTATGEVGLDEALEIIDQAIITLVAVGGLEMAHMTRDHGWRFLSIGRHLERLSFVAATLGEIAASGARAEPALLEWLLDLSDSLVSYRTRFTHRPEWSRVLDLLWLDPHNPRSGAFQLGKLAKHLTLLPGADMELTALVAEIEHLLAAQAEVELAQGELFDDRPGVHVSIATANRLAGRVSDALTLRFFSHVYDLGKADDLMGVLYRVEHETRYVHAGRASTSQHVACLKPRVSSRQTLHEHALDVTPAPASMSERVDYFGNVRHQFEILTPYSVMRAVSRSIVEVWPRPLAIEPDLSPAWETVRDADPNISDTACDGDAEFRYASPYVVPEPALATFARESFLPGRPVLAAAMELMHRIHAEFRFDPGATTITTPVSKVLADRHGVCQDFAHLQIGCLWALGLPARYVSGYLLTDPPPGQPRLIGADASHAWLAVRCPRHGWVDSDPTNDALPETRHVTVAWGRDYGDISPLRGIVLGGQEQQLQVGVSVIPIESPESPV